MESLKRWFKAEKRSFPWREDPTPYAVWVSEVMLQQTQASVVIPYFKRWMRQFPTIEVLASATSDEVVKAWEGLGYYSRARNLHQGAKYVVEHHDGDLPSTHEELSKIKGLGPYTVGAILNFAFHQRAHAVDGNVIRVLSRFFAIKEDISKSKTINLIREKALKMLPESEPWVVSEALIELGASLCKKVPQCHLCPLQTMCQSHQQGIQLELPYKSKKVKIEQLYRTVCVIISPEAFLIKRVESGKVMSGLHEFFYFEEWLEEEEAISRLDLSVQSVESLPLVEHSFTRYQVKLRPYLLRVDQEDEVEGYQWVSKGQVEQLAFSSGHRRLLQSIGASVF